MGRPFMPVQQHIVDVGCEVLPSGRWAYPTVMATVMRQVGKTTTLDAVTSHRGQMLTDETLWMTAQNGKKARARWLALTERLVKKLGPSTFKRNIGVSHELLRWVTSGSQLFPFAPGGDSEDMHGESPAFVSCDEIWFFDAETAAALQQAYLPGMITKNAQEWLTSTQGTAESEWLNDMTEVGRQAVLEGRRTGIAYFEASIPAEVDGLPVEMLDDERLLDLICENNPAVGYTQTREGLAAHLERFMQLGDRQGFIRGYGNVRLGSARPRVIPEGQWRAARTELAIPGPVGLAVVVDGKGENVAVVAAGRTEHGQAVVEVVQVGAGWWLDIDGEPVSPVAFVQHLQGKHPVCTVAVLTSGANRDLADQFAAVEAENVLPVGPADHAAATTRFRVGIKDLTVLHRGQPSLDEAARVAELGKLAGGMAWAPAKPEEPVTALDAATLAVWAVDHPGEILGEFVIF